MKIKDRKLLKSELDLWKKVTQNDQKLNSYISDIETIKEFKDKDKDKIEKAPLKSQPKTIDYRNKEKVKKILKKNFERPQANRKVLSKLERGKLKPEACLDLHGFNKINAKEAVFKFIKKSIINEFRCVLIITGKKNSYTGAKGILRESLPMWLKEKELSSYVLGNNYASIKDGGDGARYVLLRKKNKVFKNE